MIGERIVPTEISKHKSEESYWFNVKQSHFLGKKNCKEICRRSSSSYSSQKVVIKHEHNGEKQEKTATKTSNEPYLYCRKQFHKNSL